MEKSLEHFQSLWGQFVEMSVRSSWKTLARMEVTLSHQLFDGGSQRDGPERGSVSTSGNLERALFASSG